MQMTVLDHCDPAQAETIRQLLVAAYRVEARLLEVEHFPPLDRSSQQIQEADSIFLGCLHRSGPPGSPPGLVAVAEIEQEHDHDNIASFVVAPAMFRRGIGSALLEHLLCRTADRPVTVSTGAANLPAISLYERHGFAIAKRWRLPDGLRMVTLCRNL